MSDVDEKEFDIPKLLLILNVAFCVGYVFFVLRVGSTFVSIYQSFEVEYPLATWVATKSYIVFAVLIPLLLIIRVTMSKRVNLWVNSFLLSIFVFGIVPFLVYAFFVPILKIEGL